MPSSPSFDLSGASPPLADLALPVGVFRKEGNTLEHLPNVRCLQVDHREGPDPPTARFMYITDDTLASVLDWPCRMGQLWPIDALGGPYAVRSDDRIVVAGQQPDGSLIYFFDGFAQIPQADLTPQAERITFAAVGVAARTFDDTIMGRVQRDADPEGLDDTSGSHDVLIELPCRFNPADQAVGNEGQFRGNMTPKAIFTTDEGNSQIDGGTGLGDFPVFVDPKLTEREKANQYDPDTLISLWTIPEAVKYLLSQPNPGNEFVGYPSFDVLDDLLASLAPPEGSDTFDPETAVSTDILIRDYDATHKPPFEAVIDLLEYAGFVMAWVTTSDSGGGPQTVLKIYRRDAADTRTPKVLYLDKVGATLDLSRNNVTAAHLARDANAIVNAWRIETAPKQVEVSIVLAPGYQPDSADASFAQRKTYLSSALSGQPADTQRKYRYYIADECGDGHWLSSNQTWDKTPLDLSDVFPDVDGKNGWVIRYREPSRTIAARDDKGKPRKAELAISFDYAGNAPGIWDGTGTWRTIAHGWHLLDDRLGIKVTENDLENWSAGKAGISYGKDFVSAQDTIPGGTIRGIKWWADPPTDPPTNGQTPVLMLTTLIDDDRGMDIKAEKRTASPTTFSRRRSADANDHFNQSRIDKSSIYYDENGGDGTEPVLIRDDTKRAQTHADQLRSAHEFPPLAGSVTIPFLTDYYRIGDRISLIKGRDISLQANINTSNGEAPALPWVVGVSFLFEPDRQMTTLQLSDRRAEVRNAW